MKSRYYVLVDGEPVGCDDVLAWGKFFANRDISKIGYTEIGGIAISTVFLGVDHSYGGGEPLLFETMVFGGEYSEYQERYSTKKQAIEGHEKTVRMVFGRKVLFEKLKHINYETT